jgi:hypothetical protein
MGEDSANFPEDSVLTGAHNDAIPPVDALEVEELEVGPELEGLAIEACRFPYLPLWPGLP